MPRRWALRPLSFPPCRVNDVSSHAGRPRSWRDPQMGKPGRLRAGLRDFCRKLFFFLLLRRRSKLFLRRRQSSPRSSDFRDVFAVAAAKYRFSLSPQAKRVLDHLSILHASRATLDRVVPATLLPGGKVVAHIPEICRMIASPATSRAASTTPRCAATCSKAAWSRTTGCASP